LRQSPFRLDDITFLAKPQLEKSNCQLVVSVFQNVTTKKGDSLWKIALKQYGYGARWPEIYAMNMGVIGGNPDFLDIGMVLTIKTE